MSKSSTFRITDLISKQSNTYLKPEYFLENQQAMNLSMPKLFNSAAIVSSNNSLIQKNLIESQDNDRIMEPNISNCNSSHNIAYCSCLTCQALRFFNWASGDNSTMLTNHLKDCSSFSNQMNFNLPSPKKGYYKNYLLNFFFKFWTISLYLK